MNTPHRDSLVDKIIGESGTKNPEKQIVVFESHELLVEACNRNEGTPGNKRS